MNPLNARLWFKWRALINALIVAAIFLTVAFVVAPYPFAWAIDAALIGFLAYLYFFILEKHAVSIECPHCTGTIATNTPWICGFCEYKNENVDKFPFINRCENCGAEAKAYQCHHKKCNKRLIFLSDDMLQENYARCAQVPLSTLTNAESALVWHEQRKLENELTMTDLNARVEEARRRAEYLKKRNPMERKAIDLDEYLGDQVGAQEVARAKKAENAEKYKDDPEQLERSNDAVDGWLRRQI